MIRSQQRFPCPVVVAVGVLTVGCSKTPTYSSQPTPMPLAIMASDFAWSADGREIYFVGAADTFCQATCSSLRAIDPQTGATRMLVTESGLIDGVAASPGGAYVYFALPPNTVAPALQYPLHRVAATGGGDTILATTVQEFWRYTDKSFPSPPYRAVVTSPDRRRVAFSIVDSAGRDVPSILDETTGVEQFIGTGLPIAFSPDGSQLLEGTEAVGITGTIPVAGGTITPLDGPGVGHNPQALLWGPVGIELLTIDTVPSEPSIHDASVYNLTTGLRTALPALHGVTGCSGIFYQAFRSAWSPDGAAVALWSGVGIYLVDVPSATIRTLVNVHSFCGDRLAFSPDGRHLAFLSGARIYIATVL